MSGIGTVDLDCAATAVNDWDTTFPFAWAMVGEHGSILDANPQFASLAGCPAGTLVATSVTSLFPEWEQLVAAATHPSKDVAPRIQLQTALLHAIGQVPRECFVHVERCGTAELRLFVFESSTIARGEVFREIIDKTSAVIYLKDLDGRYRFVNRQFEDLFGIPRRTIAGLTDFELFPDDMARDFRANDEWVASSGLPLQTEEVAPHLDGPHTYLSVKFPLRGPDGAVNAIAGISTDMTDLVRADLESRRLRDELQLVLDSVADGLIGVDESGRITFANRAAALMLRQPTEAVTGKPLLTSFSGSGFGTAFQEVLSQRCGARQGKDRVALSALETLPIEYSIAALGDSGQATRIVVTFRDLTERMARERVEHEMLAAHAVQKSLYPPSAPSCPGWDVAGAAFPASMACGDYYDFLRLSEDRMALVIGDVSGHGLGSAVTMVETRAYLRSLLISGADLAETMECLNEFLVVDLPEASFVTLFVALVNLPARELTYVGAGHAGYRLRANGVCQTLPSTGTVLGFSSRMIFPCSKTITLDSGDLLLLPTDGIQECLSAAGELYGVDRLLQHVQRERHRPACELTTSIFEECRRFHGPLPQQDDISLVVARVLGS